MRLKKFNMFLVALFSVLSVFSFMTIGIFAAKTVDTSGFATVNYYAPEDSNLNESTGSSSGVSLFENDVTIQNVNSSYTLEEIVFDEYQDYDNGWIYIDGGTNVIGSAVQTYNVDATSALSGEVNNKATLLNSTPLGNTTTANIKGYVVKNSSTNKYKLYVLSYGKIYAPADCSYFFSGLTNLKNVKLNNFYAPTVGGVTGIIETQYMFNACSTLVSINIPNLFTSIGERCFYNCSRLTSLTIPSSVTSIGSYTFSGCTNLTSITIPSSVTSIGSYAFQSCSSLTNVVIPSSVTSIGSYAFRACFALKDITLSNSLTTITNGMFYLCIKLRNIIIPDSVTSIESSAFFQCYGLIRVRLGSSLNSIASGAFQDCYKLVEVYNKSNLSITAGSSYNGLIAKNVYTPNTGSSKLVIESGLTYYIDGNDKILMGFADTYFENITISSGCTEIYRYAFRDNAVLKTVIINSAVTKIGDYAFYGCPLTSVTFQNYDNWSYYDNSTSTTGTAISSTDLSNTTTAANYLLTIGYANKYWKTDNVATLTLKNNSGTTLDTIYALKSSDLNDKLSDYVSNQDATFKSSYSCWFSDSACTSLISDWRDLALTNNTATVYTHAANTSAESTNAKIYIPFSITSIAQSTITGTKSNVTEVYIPNTVTTIGDSALFYCQSLTSVTIPNSVTSSIGNDAFAACSSLTSVTIGNSVTSIGDHAFQSCSNLTSITIPDSVTSIGSGAFYFCSSLTSVTIGNSVSSIEISAFNGCSSLTSINVDSDNPNYSSEGDVLFNKGKTTLIRCPEGKSGTSYTIPKLVTSIGNSAFYACSSLTSVTIPSLVTSIGNRAFCACSSLTSVTIPSSVTSIEDYAFSDCTSLRSVSLSPSVKYINAYAFWNCTMLNSIDLNNVNEIGISAFKGCSSLTSLTVGAIKIGQYAFHGCTALSSVSFLFSGWKLYTTSSYTGSYISTSGFDSSQNATWLRLTYANRYWKCG